jgi:hypothetical protein
MKAAKAADAPKIARRDNDMQRPSLISAYGRPCGTASCIFKIDSANDTHSSGE